MNSINQRLSLPFSQNEPNFLSKFHKFKILPPALDLLGQKRVVTADVKRAIRSASILNDGRAVFNIAGNKYRIVVWINYPYRVVYVRFIGTHRQYDRVDAQTV
jgi:mRNA interferase HigB